MGHQQRWWEAPLLECWIVCLWTFSEVCFFSFKQCALGLPLIPEVANLQGWHLPCCLTGVMGLHPFFPAAVVCLEKNRAKQQRGGGYQKNPIKPPHTQKSPNKCLKYPTLYENLRDIWLSVAWSSVFTAQWLLMAGKGPHSLFQCCWCPQGWHSALTKCLQGNVSEAASC